MRIAFIGPRLSEAGAPYVGVQFLRTLADLGAPVDCYLPSSTTGLPGDLLDRPGLRFFGGGVADERQRGPAIARYLTGQARRMGRERQAVHALLAEHRRRPYDLIWQFGKIELLSVRRHLNDLPPLVVHPEVHSAGEARWHWRERDLARRCEGRMSFATTETMLRFRSVIQRRDLRYAGHIVAPSERFARYLVNDCAVPRPRITVVANPVDLDKFRPVPKTNPTHPFRLLFVARISVRKGVEQVVQLSHRLADLEGKVEISIVGDPTTWSNYVRLLDELHPQVARYRGHCKPGDTPHLYSEADALLLPSHYEPFGLTVAESLASGVPVVASDEVGAAEGIPSEVCRVFPAGDTDAFEACTRELISLSWDRRACLASEARAAAERSFDQTDLGRKLIDCFRRVEADSRV